MNIFYLDDCPRTSAQLMNDQHVVKMILESAQLLSTAHWVLDGHCKAYRKTHENHPSAIWVRESTANYMWLYDHLNALITEHQHRYPSSKVHKTAEHLNTLSKVPHRLPEGSLTPIRLAMPDLLQSLYSGSEAYRMYYSLYKRVRANGRPYTWTNREVPEWF